MSQEAAGPRAGRPLAVLEHEELLGASSVALIKETQCQELLTSSGQLDTDESGYSIVYSHSLDSSGSGPISQLKSKNKLALAP